MNRTFLTLALLLSAGLAHADAVGDFEARVRSEYLKPFARDLGGVIGSASAHQGRTLGFPGFWVGAVAATQSRPDRDDRILRDSNVKSFGVPMLEAQVGLPLKFDVIVHGFQASGVKIFGGGVRYGLYRTDTLDSFLPNVSVSVIQDRLTHEAFTADHTGLNATAMWNLPIVKPFALYGGDITKIKVRQANTPGLTGVSETARGYRLNLGVDLVPFPFVNLRAAYALRHGIGGADLALGIKF